MAEGMTYRARIFYQKKGRLVHLSHLEVIRTLERAIRRAGLPYAISQGFSPHMKIAFGAALPVGVGGLRECFDVQLTRYVKPEELLKILQAASVKDLMVLSCSYIDKKEPAASVAYPIGVYEVKLSQSLDELQVPETITVIRKKKEKQLVVADFLYEPIEHEGDTLIISLEAKPTGSLRIDVLVKELLVNSNNTVPLSLIRTKQRTF